MICEPKPTTVYIVEHPDGLCRIHLSPAEDMIGSSRERDFEEQLRAKFVWVERLGTILPGPEGTFAASDCDKLVLHSSKRMVLVSNWDTPEYRACEWNSLPLM